MQQLADRAQLVVRKALLVYERRVGSIFDRLMVV
jgi:hypothetical protein